MDTEFSQIAGTKRLKHAELVALIERAQAGDKDARDEVILANIRLVVSIAQRMKSPVPIEDRVSYGVIGLIRAVENFDASRGYRFSTYATPCIKQFIFEAVYQFNIIRTPRHAMGGENQAAVFLEASLADEQSGLDQHADHREPSIEHVDRADTIEFCLQKLPPRMAKFVRLRHGLKDGVRRSRAEAGKLVGVSVTTATKYDVQSMDEIRYVIGCN